MFNELVLTTKGQELKPKWLGMYTWKTQTDRRLFVTTQIKAMVKNKKNWILISDDSEL